MTAPAPEAFGTRTDPDPRDSQELVFLSKAFLTAVLQDYGRAHGIATDALTFTHQVIPDTIGSKEEEFSIMIQKKLNLVRRAFKVPGCSKGGRRNHSFIPAVIPARPYPALSTCQAPGGRIDRAQSPSGPLSLRETSWPSGQQGPGSLEGEPGARCPSLLQGTAPATPPSAQRGEQVAFQAPLETPQNWSCCQPFSA